MCADGRMLCAQMMAPTTDMINFSVWDGVGVVTQLFAQAWANQPLVQILVVVSNIPMITLKAEVEMGSM